MNVTVSPSAEIAIEPEVGILVFFFSTVDIQYATKEQLMTLPGVTAAQAGGIIAGRPYTQPELMVQRQTDLRKFCCGWEQEQGCGTCFWDEEASHHQLASTR